MVGEEAVGEDDDAKAALIWSETSDDTSGAWLRYDDSKASPVPLESRECEMKGLSEDANPGLSPLGGVKVILVGSVMLAGRCFLNKGGSSASGWKPTFFLSFALMPPALPGRLGSMLLR